MSTLEASSLNIPHFITAKNPRELQKKMLQNNIKDSMQYQYTDIVFDGKQWIAWFIKKVDIDITVNTEGKLDVNVTGS